MNPLHKRAKKRKVNLITGIVLTSICGVGLLLALILSLTVFKNILDMDGSNFDSQAMNIYYVTIVFLVLFGVSGILFITGKFDKKIKVDEHLKDIIELNYGLDAEYKPLLGVNIDEVNSLKFVKTEFSDFSDYLKGVTDSDVLFECSYLSNVSFEKTENKRKRLLEIKKYNIGDDTEKVLDSNSKDVKEISGTCLIFRNISDSFDGKLVIKHRDIEDGIIEDMERVIFSDSRKEFQHRCYVYSDNVSKADNFIDSKKIASYEKLCQIFKNGIVIVYCYNHVYVFINKFYMNLAAINEDRKLTKDERDSLIYKSLERLAYVNDVLNLKGTYKSIYKDIFKPYYKNRYKEKLKQETKENLDNMTIIEPTKDKEKSHDNNKE